MDFTYILNDCTNPYYNLALEETLFHEAEHKKNGFIMLWQNTPTVVVGKFQNTAEEVNKSYIDQYNIAVVRRNSGGGAVYHDEGNLNYTIIFPTLSSSLLDIQAFSIPLLQFLHSLNIQAERSGRNDVTVDGRKISGAAQYSANGIVLYHGALLFHSDLEKVSSALKADPLKFQSKGFKSVRSRIVNLSEYLPKEMSLDIFKKEFAKVLISFYSAAEVRKATAEEKQKACELTDKKYFTWDWNWGASPNFTLTNKRRLPGGTIQLGLAVEGGVVTNCRIYGDYFSLTGPEEVQRRLTGIRYPFTNLDKILDDELLSHAFNGIAPLDIRDFLLEQ